MEIWAMGKMWCEDRARELRAQASRAEKAYTKGQLAEMCRNYASALRRAASDLTEEAERMQRHADETRSTEEKEQ